MAKKKSKNKPSFWEENKVNIIAWIVVILIFVGGFAGARVYGNIQTQARLDTLSVREDDMVVGTETAANVLVEYSDFQCPFCAQYFPIVDELKTNYSDQVRVVYRHFPLQNAHPNAEAAHVASMAAANQGSFWGMHDLLFENQAEWSNVEEVNEVFITYAEQLELDLEQFEADLSDAELLDRVLADKREGAGIGVNATPTFFLNGEELTLEDINYDVQNIVDRFIESDTTDTSETESSTTSTSTASEASE